MFCNVSCFAVAPTRVVPVGGRNTRAPFGDHGRCHRAVRSIHTSVQTSRNKGRCNAQFSENRISCAGERYECQAFNISLPALLLLRA
eukprot:365046-Chlamydomonas_euryale.AAC.3